MAKQSLFQKIVTASGLSPLIAPGTLRRALRDVGADPSTATPLQYQLALPKLEVRLRVYLAEHEVEARIEEIRRLLSPLLDEPP